MNNETREKKETINGYNNDNDLLGCMHYKLTAAAVFAIVACCLATECVSMIRVLQNVK